MKRSLVCVLSVLALALSAPVMAQSEQSASGTVVSSTSNQLVISTADGRQMTFMIDNNTTRPGSLSQGSNVTVRYHDMNGTFHAANVTASSGTTGSSTTGTMGTTGSTATGTSAASANAQDRGTTADPTGNDARNTRTTAEDVTGTTGTSATTGSTGTQRNMPATTAGRSTTSTGANAPQETTGTTTADADQDTSGRLPATASPLPLMGLSGLLALAGGLGMRIVRRRS
ncbi:MAG TPA: hypothetical protein VIG50_01305 [Vicinamibacteria bacterium]|jgi:hypothetical protein